MTDPDHARDRHLPAAPDTWPDSPVPLSSVHADHYRGELAPVTRGEVAELVTHIAAATRIHDRHQPRPRPQLPSEDLWPLLIVFTMFAVITILAFVTIAVVILGT
jgi:hypothetical protein